MKSLLLFLSVIVSLTILPATTFAKDKKDDDWKKQRNKLQEEVKGLQVHYNLISDRVRNLGGQRRQFEELRGIQGVINDLNAQLDHAHYLDSRDRDDIDARIGQAHQDLLHIQTELDAINSGQGRERRGYYRRD